MKNKQKLRAEKAARAVREYVEAPDPEIDLDEHFAGVNRTASRAALVEQIRSGNVSFGDIETFAILAEYFGIGDQLEALGQIVRDRSLDLDRRALAVSLLDENEPGSGMSLLTDEEDRIAVMTALWRGLIDLCLQDADTVEAVTDLFTNIDDEVFFDFVDPLRREAGAPATLLYGEALADPGASLFHARMIEALVAEASIGSLELVERLAGTLTFEREQRSHRAAAMRIRTALAEAVTPEGERGGSLSRLTRQSAILRFWFRAPGGNRVCVVALLETGGRLRAPLITPSIPYATFELEQKATDAPISFEQAASFFLTFEAAPDSGLDRSALAIARTIARIELPPAAAPATSFTDEELETILEGKEYEGWHLIPEVDADYEFDPDDPTEDDKQQFLARLAADEDAVEILRWMCDYQSRWHLARGEERASAIMERLAVDLPSNFANSLLPRLLLERTLGLWIPESDLDDDSEEFDELAGFGDESSSTLEEESGRSIRRITLAAVDNQLRANAPRAARRALDRLKSLGYSEADAKSLMAGVLAVEMFALTHRNAPPDPTRLERRYDALPEVLDFEG